MASYKILSVEMNGETYKVGDTVWHVDGTYSQKIRRFEYGGGEKLYFYGEGIEACRDLNNFRLAGKGIRAQIAEDESRMVFSSPAATLEDFNEMMKLVASKPSTMDNVEFPIRYFADGYHWQITSFSCQRSLDGKTWEEAEHPEGFAEAVIKALQKRAKQ